MESKVCTQCKTEKHINSSYNKYTERKECTCKRGLKHFYENKDKISKQQKTYCAQKRNKLIQKQNNRYINLNELL